jgi:hypothetical protein
MSVHIDDEDRFLGKKHNNVRNINCPRCDKPMKKLSDPVQKHIQYEACTEHDMYFDTDEFTDFKYETLMDIFRDFVLAIRKSA